MLKKNKPEKKAESVAVAAESDLEQFPKRAVYDRSVFYSVAWRELLIDALLFFFSIFISDEFFSAGGLFHSLKAWQIVAMYCVVILTMPYYFGYLYVRDSVFYPKPVMRVLLWLFILMTIMVLVNLVRLVVSLDWIEEFGEGNNFIAMFAMFLLVLGPMMSLGGSMSARDEFTKKQSSDPGKFNADKLMPAGVFILLILAIALMIYFVGILPKDAWWSSVLAYFGGPVAAVIIYGLFIAFLSFLDKMGLYRPLAFVATNTFPLFIISVLVFWSGVAIYFMKSDFAGSNGRLSFSAVLLSLCLSGLIPFRLILMFNPPWRIANIISGAVSLTYFFWRLFDIIN